MFTPHYTIPYHTALGVGALLAEAGRQFVLEHAVELGRSEASSEPEGLDMFVGLSKGHVDWEPDHAKSSCSLCFLPFTALVRRRHHCRCASTNARALM